MAYLTSFLTSHGTSIRFTALQPSMLQLLPSSAEPSREDVFIADSLNGIQLSHIKKALSDSGQEYGNQLNC